MHRYNSNYDKEIMSSRTTYITSDITVDTFSLFPESCDGAEEEEEGANKNRQCGSRSTRRPGGRGRLGRMMGPSLRCPVRSRAEQATTSGPYLIITASTRLKVPRSNLRSPTRTAKYTTETHKAATAGRYSSLVTL